MSIGLVLVTYAHYPEKLIESIERSSAQVTWYIHHHGPDGEICERIALLASRANFRVYLHKTNRGLSRSWNEGLHEAYAQDGCSLAFLLNDDLFFIGNGFEKFLEYLHAQEPESYGLAFVNGLETGGSPYHGMVQQQGFACCALTRLSIDKVGYFDQNIAPAYYEDLDYDARCRRENVAILCNTECLIEHERSKTSRTALIDVGRFARNNKAYFERKWDPKGQGHAHPFGDVRFSNKIAWEDRADPYPGYDVKDTQEMTTSLISPSIPSGYRGSPYFEVMGVVSAKRDTGNYLEIGVSTGLLLQHIRCKSAYCVDPSFSLNQNIMTNKKRAHLLQMTSDSFFRDNDCLSLMTGPIDLAFLDGMHTFEFLLRDFYNTERLSSSHSLIALHDCLPLNAEMAHRDMATSLQIGQQSSHPNYWTGDVWKIILILQKYRADLKIVCVDAPPTGIVFISRLDCSSTVLKNNYHDIVEEFKILPNTLEEIEKMFRNIEILPTSSIMQDFDHSLFFQN